MCPLSEETMSRGTADPVDLSHFDPWLREVDCGCSRECETQERRGVLVESWVAGGVLAVRHAHLSVKVLSWVKVVRREAAWRHSALTRACSRLSREAHVCREKQRSTQEDWRVGGKGCLQQMMAPLILLWSQTDAILELLDSHWHAYK